MKDISRKRNITSGSKFFPILIFIATIFMGIGYASINSIAMNVDGEVTAKVPSGIYITKVNYKSDVNANLKESKILSAYKTNLSSYVVLSDKAASSSITYEIKVSINIEKEVILDE